MNAAARTDWTETISSCSPIKSPREDQACPGDIHASNRERCSVAMASFMSVAHINSQILAQIRPRRLVSLRGEEEEEDD